MFDKPLPNPYADHHPSPELITPADDKPLPNPYADAHGHPETSEAARADTPNPYDRLPPVRPLRVAKRAGSAAEEALARPPHAHAFDMGRTSRDSGIYTLPALQISASSLMHIAPGGARSRGSSRDSERALGSRSSSRDVGARRVR